MSTGGTSAEAPRYRLELRAGQLWYNGRGDIDLIVAIDHDEQTCTCFVVTASPGDDEELLGTVYSDPDWALLRSEKWKLLSDA